MKKLALIFSLVLVAAGLVIFFWTQKNDDTPAEQEAPAAVNTIDYSPSTEEDAAYVESIKQEVSEETDASQSNLTYSIVSASISQSTLTVGSTLSGYASGSCMVSVSDGVSSVSIEADMIDANSGSGCVSKLDFSSLDTDKDWQIDATATLENGEVLTASSTLTKEQR